MGVGGLIQGQPLQVLRTGQQDDGHSRPRPRPAPAEDGAHAAQRWLNSSVFWPVVVPGRDQKKRNELSRQFRARKIQSGRQVKAEGAGVSLRGDPGSRPNCTSCLSFPICQVRRILAPTPQGCWGPR